MNAALFTVSQSGRNWLVLDGDRVTEIFFSRFWALKGADTLAYKRHLETGWPTAVAVNMTGVDAVIMERHDYTTGGAARSLSRPNRW